MEEILSMNERIKIMKKIDENKLVSFWNLGLSDREIAKKFKCNCSTVYRWRARLGLEANHLSYSGVIKSKIELKEAYNDYAKQQSKNNNRRNKLNKDKLREYASRRRKVKI